MNTYETELNNIKEQFNELFCISPFHRSYCGTDGNSRNVSRNACISMLKGMGYTLESTIHANGIGNNNENKVVKRYINEDGYAVDTVIGYFHYTYSMYAKVCYYWFEDYNRKQIYHSPTEHGNRTFSENE